MVEDKLYLKYSRIKKGFVMHFFHKNIYSRGVRGGIESVLKLYLAEEDLCPGGDLGKNVMLDVWRYIWSLSIH